MVKKWKTKKKDRRNKVLAATLLGAAILVILGAIAVPVFSPSVTNQPQETSDRGPKKAPVANVAARVSFRPAERTPASKPVREPFRRKPEQPPATKPARQTPIHIESMSVFNAHVLDAGGICLVDLFSDRCPPCRVLAPTISSLAKKYAGKVTVCKVDVDRLRQLARRYRIRAIPTVLIIKDGKVVNRLVGLRREAQYVALLDKLLEEE